MDKLKKNKHHIVKIVISLIVIPVITLFLNKVVVGKSQPIPLFGLVSIGITYILLTVYDITIIKESEKTMEYINKNARNIKLIKEDVRVLQSVVHSEEKKKIREQNAQRAMKRKGEVFEGGGPSGGPG